MKTAYSSAHYRMVLSLSDPFRCAWSSILGIAVQNVS